MSKITVSATTLLISIAAYYSTAHATEPYQSAAFRAVMDSGLHYRRFRSFALSYRQPTMPTKPGTRYIWPPKDPNYISESRLRYYANEAHRWSEQAVHSARQASISDSKHEWLKATWYHHWARGYRWEIQQRGAGFVGWSWIQADIKAEKDLYAAWQHASRP
jgi:hypothetical protein